jgi:hypothetical protein
MIDFANSRDFTADDKIIPDPEDYRTIERKFGRLPDNASDARRTQYYRLVQAQKLMRVGAGGPLTAFPTLSSFSSKATSRG